MTRLPIALAFAVGGLVPCAVLAQSVENHVTCYALKDSSPRAKYQVTLTNSAGSQTCTLRTPARFACVSTAVSMVTPPPAGDVPHASASGAFLCYRAKCAPPSSITNVEDQFGRRVVKFKGARFICGPASLTAPSPGISPTTTTTLPGNNTCHYDNGACTGTCAPGKKCGAVVGTASCECRNVPCGDADSPECNGACPDADQACIFNVSGCGCVRIP